MALDLLARHLYPAFYVQVLDILSRDGPLG